MITAGALRLVPVDDDVILEIAPDDWPTRFPWLDEPREQRANASLCGETAYGQVAWIGIPSDDGRVVVEVTTAGNRVARFRWSSVGGGEDWNESGQVVPLGESFALGDTGLTAEFAASPAPEGGTTYTFSGPGVADQDGDGPEVTITGSGSIDGVIEIETGVGAYRYSADNGETWSSVRSMATSSTISDLGIEVEFPDDEFLGLEIADGSRFEFRVRGYFTIRLRRGAVVEIYERFRVSDPLFFASPHVPTEKRSRLVTSASWVGEVRPPPGPYESTP